MPEFSGKSIVVIGGSSGIGFDLTKKLLNEGANVYSFSRQKPDIGSSNFHYTELDATKDVSVMAAYLPELIDGFVYCPGTINLKPFARLSPEDFTQDFQVNLIGAVKTIQAALKSLKNSKNASIVLFSTVAVQTGMGFHASVTAAKGAVEGFGRSLAAELAPQKIRVNTIAPSLTDTPLANYLLGSPEKKEASGKRHPIGRYGEVGDLSSIAMFLLSEDASWITGQVIGVDGGMGSLK